MTRILVVDNYDTFVYTIVGYLAQLGAETVVVRNDAVPPHAQRSGFDGVLVSPGPGNPGEAGESLQVLRNGAAITAAVASIATAWRRYPTVSTRCLGNRSPRAAAGAARSAAGTSWASATTPTDAGPVCS